jgi:hypothetical protein
MGVWNFLGWLGLTRSTATAFDARIEELWKGVNVATYHTKLGDLAVVKDLLATEGEERAEVFVQCASGMGRPSISKSSLRSRRIFA